MKITLFILFLFLTISNANEKVILQLKWFHQFQFAGYYAAKEKGFYKDEGLDVEIRERNIDSNNIEQVIDNDAQYGVADSVLFLYIAKNKPLQIVAPIFQHSPNVLITLKESGLDSPYKLNNKKIHFYKKDADGFGILGMLKALHVHPTMERIKTQDDYKLLLSGEIDGYASYLTNEPFLLQQEGARLNIINPTNYGFDLYGDMLFTNSQEALNHPLRVEAFKRASLKGWEYALKNKEEIIKLIKEKYETKRSTEILRYEAKTIDHFIEADFTPIGTLDEGRLTYILELYKNHGLLDSSVQIDKYIFSSYAPNIDLSLEEKNFLLEKKELKMCIDPDWMPFEKFDGNTHIGMTADYFKIIEQKLDIPIKAVYTKSWSESLQFGKDKKCDIFSLVMPTEDRKEFLNFTNSYLRAPLVIITRLDELFIDKIENLKGKKIGMVKNYAFTEILLDKYPFLEAVLFDTVEEMLEAVKNKKIFAAVEALSTSGYYIQKDYVGELKITGKFEEMWELGVGTRKDEPLLKTIFNKVLSNISAIQHQTIANKWISVNYENEKSYLIFLYWLGGLLFFVGTILTIIMKVNKNLNKEVKTRIKVEKELQKLITLYGNLSITDELTSLYNRRHFNETFSKEINRAKRDSKSICFIMLDVDLFKSFNDTYGHQKGDEALKKVSKILKDYTKRGGDFAFRLGGEEFGIILASSDYKESLNLAESIRESVENANIEHIHGQNKILTISIGLVFYSAPKDITADKFYKQTDDNLYLAKQQGRNKIISTFFES